jgi:Flp pilus assembly pilin Flp
MKSGTVVKNNRGQGMTEYILIVALIAVLAIGAIKFFGNSTASNFTSAANATNAAVGSGVNGGSSGGAANGVLGAVTGGH